MKNIFSISVAGTIGAGLLLSAGCVQRRVVYVQQPAPVYQQPGEPAVVAEPPPPPKTEVIVAAPGPEYSWVPGYWSWNGGWVWIGGRWIIGPHPHAVWVGPRYIRRGHAYIYHRGYWR